MTRKLVLLRHGQSQWNLDNRFTGWVDVDITEQGRQEAVKAGELMREEGLLFDVAHTSVLRRAIRTMYTALDVMDQMWLPVHKTWRLNERHYGALQGLDKAETTAKHGEAQVKIWRRSYDIPPPPLDEHDGGHPRYDRRDVEIDDVLVGHMVQILVERAQRVAVGGHEHGLAGLELRCDGVVPVGQHAIERRLQRLGRRQHGGV